MQREMSMRAKLVPSAPRRPVPWSRKVQIPLCRNRILFEPHEVHPPRLVPGQSLSLCTQDARAVHLRDVVRVQPGDTVRVGVVGGLRANARVQTDPKSISSLELTVTSTHPPLPPPKVDLLLALPRPKALKRLFPVLSEIGLGTVVLCGAERVEKSFWTSKVLEPSKVREGLVKGLEQCGDTEPPTIILSRTLSGGIAMLSRPASFQQPHTPAAHCTQHTSVGQQQPDEGGSVAGNPGEEEIGQDPLPWGVSFLCRGSAVYGRDIGYVDGAPAAGSRAQGLGYTARALAHPQEDSPALLQHVLGCLQAWKKEAHAEGVGGSDSNGAVSGDGAVHSGRVLLAIGPEGGWRAAELELLTSEEGGGFTQVSLGNRILSTTCALVSAVGTVQAAQQLVGPEG